MAWRALRSASAVTAQVLTMIASSRPAASVWRRMVSDSKRLRRQPNVTMSSGTMLAQQAVVERAGEADRDRAGHDDVIVVAPFDIERAAIGDHLGLAPGQAAPRRRDQRGAGAGAAGRGQA